MWASPEIWKNTTAPSGSTGAIETARNAPSGEPGAREHPRRRETAGRLRSVVPGRGCLLASDRVGSPCAERAIEQPRRGSRRETRHDPVGPSLAEGVNLSRFTGKTQASWLISTTKSMGPIGSHRGSLPQPEFGDGPSIGQRNDALGAAAHKLASPARGPLGGPANRSRWEYPPPPQCMSSRSNAGNRDAGIGGSPTDSRRFEGVVTSGHASTPLRADFRHRCDQRTARAHIFTHPLRFGLTFVIPTMVETFSPT